MRNPDVDKISFTGPVVEGQSFMRDGAATMKGVTLGLGGKSPTILLDDAALDQVIPAALTMVLGDDRFSRRRVLECWSAGVLRDIDADGSGQVFVLTQGAKHPAKSTSRKPPHTDKPEQEKGAGQEIKRERISFFEQRSSLRRRDASSCTQKLARSGEASHKRCDARFYRRQSGRFQDRRWTDGVAKAI